MAGDTPAVKQRARQTTVDPETGEVQVWEQTGQQWRAAYDQDAADLERWLMLGHARRLLLPAIEERNRRRKVRYTEIAPGCDVATRVARWYPVADRYRLEEEPIAAFTRLADREVIQAQRRKAVRFRVVNCCRDKIGADVAPEVWFSDRSQRASFHRVAVCGSVWICPVCSRRINLARQRQIRAAYDLFVGAKGELRPGVRDGDAVMVTFTVRHGVGDDLGELFDRLKTAQRAQLQKSYAYKRLVGYARTVNGARVKVPSVLGYVGRVSATEVTHGRHGWHPHQHELWFFDRRLTAGELEGLRAALFQAWRDACRAVGLPDPVEFSRGKAIGVDVRRALSAEEYLTKFGHDREWGPERELAAQHRKAGRVSGRTPMQLLYDAAQGDTTAGGLFRHYAEATLGRHQLQWSHGVRDRLVALGLDDILAADDELAAARDDGARLLGELNDDDWEAVIGAERFGIEAHGTLLAICKRAGFGAAVAWIRSLPSFVDHVGRRAGLDAVRQFEGSADRESQMFWIEVDAMGGVAALEDAAASLGHLVEPVERWRGWRLARRELGRVLCAAPDLQPQVSVDGAARLLVLGGGDEG